MEVCRDDEWELSMTVCIYYFLTPWARRHLFGVYSYV